MKNCLRLTFLMCLLPMLTTAAEKPVVIPSTCYEGNPFTIRIPVKFPENMTVQYAWYRNDTLVEDSHMLLLGEKAIAYTIPADKAYGSAMYHFKYNLHDKHDGEWTDSPHYVVTFRVNCPVIKVSGSIVSLTAYSSSCSGVVSDAGTISSITPAN